MNHRFLFTFLCLILVVNSSATSQEYVEVKNLDKEWLVYDTQEQLYLPVFKDEPINSNTLHLKIDGSEYKGYFLNLKLPAKSSILTNNEILAYNDHQHQYYWSIDSLKEIYKSELFLTIFNPQLKIMKEEVSVNILNLVENNTLSDNNIFQPLVRTGDFFQEFFVIAIILILLIFILIRNLYPKTAAFYYNISKALTTTTRDEQTTRMNLAEGNNLMVLILHSLIVSFVFVIILSFYDIEVRLVQIGLFGETFLSWLKIAGIVLILLIAKYLMVTFLANLFGLNFFANRHFFEFIRLSKIFYGIVILLMILFYLGFQFTSYFIVKFILYSIIFFIVIRTLVLFNKFIRTSSFTNLYLFSYLCGTEIIPLLIGFKVLIF